MRAIRDEPLTEQPEPWVYEAACAETDPELFYAEQYAGNKPYDAARRICGGCRVTKECLAYAMRCERDGELTRFGIWGGLTPLERKRLAHRIAGRNLVLVDSSGPGADGWENGLDMTGPLPRG